MRYEITSLVRALDVCAGLFDENHRESGLSGFPLVLARELYAEADAHGLSFAVIAFDGESPVGLSAVLVAPHPHAVGTLFATNDTIYARPEYRARGVGGRLFVLSEREAKRRGAAAFQWLCPVGSPLARALESRCSHASMQILFQREL